MGEFLEGHELTMRPSPKQRIRTLAGSDDWAAWSSLATRTQDPTALATLRW